MANKIIEELSPHLEKAAADEGLILWDAEFVKEGATWYLRLYVDKEGGVNIEDCERFSRAVDPILDELDLIDRSYCLEVSSPGVERKLSGAAQINRYVGEKATVKLFDAVEGRKKFVAVIDGADENALKLDLDGKKLEIPFSNVAKINLYFDFDIGGNDKK